MYDVREADGRVTLAGGDAEVQVVPARGGLVTRFRVAGDDLLYLDEGSLADPTKNVRGGIPVLFPFAGRAPDERWKQHGFARNMPWDVVGTSTDDASARLTLRLGASDATRAIYPYEFEFTLDLVLRAASLRLEIAIANRGDRPLPHALGFHPYLRVPDKARAAVETEATAGWDNLHKAPLTYRKPDFTADELDWHLFDHGLPGTLLSRPPLRPVRFDWSEEFETLVLWTVKDRDFVCVEPWLARAGAFPGGAGVRAVAPGETDRLWVAISV